MKTVSCIIKWKTNQLAEAKTRKEPPCFDLHIKRLQQHKYTVRIPQSISQDLSWNHQSNPLKQARRYTVLGKHSSPTSAANFSIFRGLVWITLRTLTAAHQVHVVHQATMATMSLQNQELLYDFNMLSQIYCGSFKTSPVIGCSNFLFSRICLNNPNFQPEPSLVHVHRSCEAILNTM